MRVWDLPVGNLCNKHLVAQHHEIHCIYSVIVNNKVGFSHHPEVMRWRGHVKKLVEKHDITVREMLSREFCHHSPMSTVVDGIGNDEPGLWQSVLLQVEALKSKGCECSVGN